MKIDSIMKIHFEGSILILSSRNSMQTDSLVKTMVCQACFIINIDQVAFLMVLSKDILESCFALRFFIINMILSIHWYVVTRIVLLWISDERRQIRSSPSSSSCNCWQLLLYVINTKPAMQVQFYEDLPMLQRCFKIVCLLTCFDWHFT